MSRLAGCRALLLDLDGVVWSGPDPIAGSVEAVRDLVEAGIPYRFVTNTTTITRGAVLAKLHGMGVPATLEQIFTPAALARTVMERSGATRYRLIGSESLIAELGTGVIGTDVQGGAGEVDWVVVALHPPSLRHEVLSVALNDLLAGARLLGLHRNRLWLSPRGPEMGLGAYLEALAYAAHVEPIIVGKPDAAFFRQAVSTLGLPPEHVAMVGDEVESDVQGAQAAGLKGVLVETGNFSVAAVERTGVRPDAQMEDLAAVVRELLLTVRA